MINIWKTEFEFESYSESGDTYYIFDDRELIGEDSLLKTNDLHFKYQKCLDGITYSYINNTDDIYNKSLLTGDGYSINNMYNEYNIIDKYTENLHRVDIAWGGDYYPNIDLEKTYHIIDNVNVKPGHLILIFGQEDRVKNGIYKITNNYLLEETDIIDTREKSDKAKFYIKLGTWKETQFFLENESIFFPINGEEKTFTPLHSYILKSKFDYDINNTDSASLLFTNYDIARHLQDNQPLYDNIAFEFNNPYIILSFEMNSGETLTLNLLNGYNYNSTIYWGDGNSSILTTTGTTSNLYTDSGRYIVVITGLFEALRLINNDNIREVISWGDPEETNLRYINFRRSNIEKICDEKDKLIYVESFERSFRTTNITEIPEYIFSSNTICSSFNSTFKNNNISEIPENLFKDNINAGDFESTFENNNLSEIPESLFSGLTNITTMESTFENNNISEIPENLFKDNINITTFKYTFKENNIIVIPENLFKDNINTISFESTFESNNIARLEYEFFKNNTLVTTFESTFKNNQIYYYYPFLFKGLNLVTTFESTFENNKIFETDDNLFKDNVSVTTFESTFKNNRLTTISQYLFRYNINVISFKSTFENNLIEKIVDTISATPITYNLFKYNTLVTTFESTFKNNKLIKLDYLFRYNVNVISFKSTFENNLLLETIQPDLFGFNINNISFEYTFKNCNKLKIKTIIIPGYTPGTWIILSTSSFFTNNLNVTNFNQCFYNCIQLDGVVEELWNRVGVSGNDCFYNCTILTNYGDIPIIWK